MKIEVIHEIEEDLSKLVESLIAASREEIRPSRLILTGSRALQYYGVPITRPLGDVDFIIDCRDHRFNVGKAEFLQRLEGLGFVTNSSTFYYSHLILNLTSLKTGKVFDVNIYHRIFNHRQSGVTQTDVGESASRVIPSPNANWVLHILRPSHIIRKKLELIEYYKRQPYFEDLVNREKHLLDLLSIHLHELDQIADIDFSKLEERPENTSSIIPNQIIEDGEDDENPDDDLFADIEVPQPSVSTTIQEAKVSTEKSPKSWNNEAMNTLISQFDKFYMDRDGNIQPVITGTKGEEYVAGIDPIDKVIDATRYYNWDTLGYEKVVKTD